MEVLGTRLRGRWTVLNGQLYSGALANRRIAGHYWVKNLLVDSPKLVPFHIHGVFGWTLLEHEVF